MFPYFMLIFVVYIFVILVKSSSKLPAISISASNELSHKGYSQGAEIISCLPYTYLVSLEKLNFSRI